MMTDSASRVALVTGGASGIGKAIVVALAAEGHRVMIVDRDADRGEAAASETGARFVQADLSTRDGCRAAVDATVDSLGPVEILINNAGFQHIDSIEEFPEDVWDRILALMLTAPFLLTKHCWPGMRRAGWGRIVNISSIHGLVASPFKSAYVSAKHGLIGLTKTAALEGGEHGITVNALCPAYTMTPLVEGQLADQARTLGIPENDVIEQVMLAPAAIKRPLDPSEVADLAAYLCSERASGITGSSFTIDLGWTAR
jgi:3-hydroxybutyrate dehydrogenase